MRTTNGVAWSLLSHHGLVLFEIAASPDITIREISDTLGITERHVSRIVRDLQDGGIVAVRRVGRRNEYALSQDARFRHPRLAHVELRQIVEMLVPQMRSMETRLTA
jgi:DNA-binding MarR family transcriptional regulator